MYQFSKREKVLLFALALVGVLAGGFLLLLNPALERRLVLQGQLSQEQLIQATMQAELASAPAAEAQRAQAKAAAAEAGKAFYQPMSNTQLSDLAAGLLDVHGLTGLSMTVSGLTVQDLAGIQPPLEEGESYAWNEFLKSAQSGGAAPEGEAPAADAAATAQVLCNTVTITARGPAEGLRGLLTDLSQRMPVRLQSFATGENDQFTLTLNIYMLDAVE
ncbi:type II secretion system protein GspM [Allofournierella sp.]|uniref:type II secretion system protein GspM n=1 Tax=Allofournierella sp. TaxID=1940256 RepID=UPI003AB33BA9